jgi:DNA-binding response OmpR family regulator
MSGSTTDVVLVIPAQRGYTDRAIQEQLVAGGARVRVAGDIQAAMQVIEESASEVVVLATGAGGAADGDAVDYLRRNGFSGAIVVVGRDHEPSSATAVLDRGADDYVGDPCDAQELVARVRAHARRVAGATLERDLGGMVLDLRRGVVRGGGVEITLTRREVDLLDYLARNAGEPVTREELAVHVWHTAPSRGGTNIVDVYVSYLRRKLAGLGRQSLIRSVRGVGYQLCPTSPEGYRSPDPQTRVASGRSTA